jgi:dipeptidyl aminopeptidase/acylaminoacyl peptidase
VDDVRDRVIRELDQIEPAADGLERTLERVHRRRARRRMSAGALGLVFTIALGTGLWTVRLERRQPLPHLGPALPSISSGVIAYEVISRNGDRLSLYTMGNDRQARLGPTIQGCCLSWSPNGGSIAFQHGISEGNGSLEVLDIANGKTRTIAAQLGHVYNDPLWSPDGKHILYTSGNGTPMVIHPDGSDMRRLLVKPGNCEVAPTAWLPDSSGFVSIYQCFSKRGAGTNSVEIDGLDGSRTTILAPEQQIPSMGPSDAKAVSYWWAAVAPDGKTVAVIITTEEAGTTVGMKLYLANIDGTNLRRIETYDKKLADPVWSPDGTQIAFIGFHGRLAQVFVMDADGRGRFQLTNSATGVSTNDLAWLPSAPPG